MMQCRRNVSGFTLIELMVSVAVLSILLVVAIPSFSDFRQRSALRGAADQVVSFWGDARFEALRRDALLRVSFQTDAAGGMCLGTETVTTGALCNCFAASGAGVCNVARFPADQAEWRRVRVAGVSTLGGSTAAAGAVVIDPKRVSITDRNDDGQILLRSPDGGAQDYRLNVAIDRNGRAVVCEPSAAPSKIPAFTNLRCGS